MEAAKIIQIDFQQIVHEIKQLSSIPIEHQSLVIDRIKKARQNPNTMLDWSEATNQLIP